MTDPWAKVATALSHDDDADADTAEADTPSGRPPAAAWGRIADGLGKGSKSKDAKPGQPEDAPAPDSSSLPSGWDRLPSKGAPAKRPATGVRPDSPAPRSTAKPQPTAKAEPSTKAQPAAKPGGAAKPGAAAGAGSVSKTGSTKPGPAAKGRPTAQDRPVGRTAPPPRSKDREGDKVTLDKKETDGKAGAADSLSAFKAKVAEKDKKGKTRASSDAPVDEDLGDDEDRRRLPGRIFAALTRNVATMVASIVVLVVIIGLAIYSPIHGGLPFTGGGVPSGDAFSVGGQNVSIKDLNTNITVLTKFYGITPPATTNKAAYSSFERTAAKAYAIDLLLDKAAPTYKVTITTDQVNKEYNTLVQQTAGGQTSTLDQLLTSAGLTDTDLRNQIRLQLLEVALYNKVVGTPTVTTAQIQQTYQQNTQALTVPETRAISHIVVADQQTANSLVTQLQGGADFATLASQNSLDTNTKSKGGALGTVAQSQLTSTFAQAAFAAPLNTVFGPVDEGQGGGWDIGLVTAINPSQPPTDNAQTQALVKQYLVGQIQNQRWQAWLAGELTRGHVTYAKAYKPTNPYAAPATTAPTLQELVLAQAEGVSTSGSSSTSATTPSS